MVLLVKLRYFFEMVSFVILGIFGGISGAFFIKAAIYIKKIQQNSQWLTVNGKKHPVLWVSFLALLTASIGYTNLFTRIDASELLEHLFAECKDEEDRGLGLCNKSITLLTFMSLIFAVTAKLALSTITFGALVPAGANHTYSRYIHPLNGLGRAFWSDLGDGHSFSSASIC
jgi:chloride channel 3/4/5